MSSSAAQDDSPHQRTTAEWVTFVGSCLVLLVVVALVGSRMLGTREPATPTATLAGVSSVLNQRQATVEVRNAGDDTAVNVTVRVEYTVDGEPDDAEQTIDFLAGAEEVTLVYVLPPGASEDDLTTRVTGFTEP